MLGKYQRIELVKYDDGSLAYLITGDKVEDCYEVDIQSDCFFNTEFKVLERTTVQEIHSIEDILNFSKTLNLDLSFRYDGTHFVVGGANDCGICQSLEFDWIDNLDKGLSL